MRLPDGAAAGRHAVDAAHLLERTIAAAPRPSAAMYTAAAAATAATAALAAIAAHARVPHSRSSRNARADMVEFPRAGKLGGAPGARHYCVAVFDNQRGGTVIGASIMRQREVVFDIASNMITFVDADCDSITPERSNLKDAYAFAPCPAAGEANVSARAPLSVDAPPDRPFAAAAAARPAARLPAVHWRHLRRLRLPCVRRLEPEFSAQARAHHAHTQRRRRAAAERH